MNRDSQNLIASLLLVLHVAFCVSAQGASIPIKFNEFGNVSDGEASARMNYVASELMHEPSVKVCIIVYAGRTDYPGTAHRYGYRIKNYLVFRQIHSSRIAVVDGGRRENQWTEIWFIQAGAPSPTPSPSLTLEPNWDRAPVKFDEYNRALSDNEAFDSWDGMYQDDVARLDSFATLLRQQPSLNAYIIARAQTAYEYKPVGKVLNQKGKLFALFRSQRFSDPIGTDRKLARVERAYLLAHGISSSRVVSIGDGYNELPKATPKVVSVHDSWVSPTLVRRTVELWLVPSLAFPPTLTHRKQR